MNYQYQLIIIGNTGKYSASIIDTFKKRIAELGINKDKVNIIDEDSFISQYTGKCPAYCLYLGNVDGNFKNIDILGKLIEDGTLILPIFYEENKFINHIPKILSNHNGFLFNSDDKLEGIVSLTLEGFGLLRNSRKLFVSYKRSESRSVAIQLYEEFEKNGFDVFLDTHSIRPGEPFQDELWNRMTDCDVIVMLNTPKFLDSQWCKEEIAEANCKLIGIVQLIWPSHELEDMAEVCFPVDLKDYDFVNKNYKDNTQSLLTTEALSRIVSKTESVRARNLASRQDNIITEFTNASRNLNLDVTLQPERYLSQKLQNGKDRIFIPTVGIPQSFDCNRSEELIDSIKRHDVDSIHLLYDHIRIRDKWLSHLEWLNKYLKIQTRKIKNIESWLAHN